jgi:hypothetical protein
LNEQERSGGAGSRTIAVRDPEERGWDRHAARERLAEHGIQRFRRRGPGERVQGRGAARHATGATDSPELSSCVSMIAGLIAIDLLDARYPPASAAGSSG